MLQKLSESSNMIQSSEIFNMADEKGISRRTLETAKKELKIKAKKINDVWYWEFNK